MESWRNVWRSAASKMFSDNGLIALRQALLEDDPRLIQGATTIPPPLMCVQDWTIEAGDLFAFAACWGDGKTTVAECEEFFAKACFDIDQILQEPAGCRGLINWYDETPRDEMRRQLLAEVTLELNSRGESNRGADIVIAGFTPDMPKAILADALDDAGFPIRAALMR